jgi:hypothetical protein
VAEFLGKEDAITFGMGFATNAASIPALAGPGTLVLSDALNHTSIVAGVKSSGAVVKVFRHNDMAHLEKLLRFHIAEGQARTHRPWKKVRGSPGVLVGTCSRKCSRVGRIYAAGGRASAVCWLAVGRALVLCADCLGGHACPA